MEICVELQTWVSIILHAVNIFVNYWNNVLHHCKVILHLHSRVLYKWNSQVYSAFLWLMFVQSGYIFVTLLGHNVLAGTQASWQLEWVLSSFYWLAFLIQGLWTLQMFLSTSLLIHMITSSSQRKNVIPAKFLSKLIVLASDIQNYCNILSTGLILALSDLLGQSTAVYAIAVLLVLTITVHGWYVSLNFLIFFYI